MSNVDLWRRWVVVAQPTSRNDSRSEPEFLQDPEAQFRFTPNRGNAVLFTSQRDARCALRRAMPTWSGAGLGGNRYWGITIFSVFCRLEHGGMTIWSEPWRPAAENHEEGRPHDSVRRASATGP